MEHGTSPRGGPPGEATAESLLQPRSLPGHTRCLHVPQTAWLRWHRVPAADRPRPERTADIRRLLSQADERARRGPGTPEPLGLIHLSSRLDLVAPAARDPVPLRGVRRSAAGHVDEDQDRRAWLAGATIRKRSATAGADRERRQVRSVREGRRGVVDRAGHGGALSRSRGDAVARRDPTPLGGLDRPILAAA